MISKTNKDNNGKTLTDHDVAKLMASFLYNPCQNNEEFAIQLFVTT